MSLKLLDVLNAPRIPLNLISKGYSRADAEVLAAVAAKLSRIAGELWHQRSWYSVRQRGRNADLRLELRRDGVVIADFAAWAHEPAVEQARKAFLKQLETAYQGRADAARIFNKLTRRGRVIAEQLAADLRVRSSPLPRWPTLQYADELSPRGRLLLEHWEHQWENLRHRPGARCANPKCKIDGGRYFVANRSQKDCQYCRRDVSKRTRSRARQKRIEARS